MIKMEKKSRIYRILSKLERLWNKYPNQRLGQLLENYIFLGGERRDATSVKLFYQGDDVTERILEDEIEWIEYINKKKVE